MRRVKQRAIRAAHPGASKAELRRLRRGVAMNAQADLGHGVVKYFGVQTTKSRESERAAARAARKLMSGFFGGGTRRKEGKTITTDGGVE